MSEKLRTMTVDELVLELQKHQEAGDGSLPIWLNDGLSVYGVEKTTKTLYTDGPETFQSIVLTPPRWEDEDDNREIVPESKITQIFGLWKSV